MAMTALELEDIAGRLRFRRNIGIGAAFVFGILMVIFVILSLGLTNASNRVSEFAARSDCRNNYTSILQKPVTQRDNLSDQVNSIDGAMTSQLGAALLAAQTGVQPTSAVVTNFIDTKMMLDAATAKLDAQIALVSKLPTADHATNYGFTLDGHHYPACPTVPS